MLRSLLPVLFYPNKKISNCCLFVLEVVFLTPTEKRYSPTERELLAIFDSVKKERVYLKGNRFICYTDHQPLTHLQTSKEILNKRYRWIEYFQELGTIIRYLPEKKMLLPITSVEIYKRNAS